MKNTETSLAINDPAFSTEISISGYKNLIARHTEQSIRAFRDGAPIFDLLKSRSDLIDRFLLNSWKHFVCTETERFALIAIGGYGRRELQPCSDIDILILHRDPVSDSQVLENFLRFLWDIGLKLGHRVSTLDECEESARTDQVYTTALIESRLLYGSDDLFNAMKNRTGPDKLWPSNLYFEAKIVEQQERYRKFNDTGFSLEPNVKEGPGGLRDIQLIAWLKKRHFRSDTLRELVDRDCITLNEYDELMSGQLFLSRIRFALHILTGRPENRLLFDFQSKLAEQFGFQNTAESSAVEQFMQKYYRTVMAVERLSDMLLQLFREIIFRGDEIQKVEAINLRFQSFGQFIEVTNPRVFKDNPLALLEVFLLQQKTPGLKGIRASTIRYIREALPMIDEQFRKNPAACRMFMEILSQRSGITHQLCLMNRYGVLPSYMLTFEHIVGRIQYDLFHIYTVDQHTLFLVGNLRGFAIDSINDELPFCKDIFRLIPKPPLLYIAALMHDIAKGKGGDHSVLGEKIAIDFCIQHGLTQHETNLVAWLVRHHLIMSMTAQKKDLSDPKVIHEFASLVGTIERLNYLYLLTVADIRATNPQMWNSWKDSLLKDLYIATQKTLHRGLHDTVNQTIRIRTSRQEARSILRRLGLLNSTIDSVWRNFSDDYFLRYSTDEAVWHTIAISASDPDELPLVLLRPQSQRGSVEILLYAMDQDHLFSRSTAIIDQLGLTILDARIVTTRNGRVINSYLVLEQSGDAIRDIYREHQICRDLQQRLSTPGPISINGGRRVARQARYFPIAPRIVFENEPGNPNTLLELTAADQPGLLSKIGQVFDRFNIRVHQAKIITIGNRAEDVFYISDKNNQPIDSDSLRTEIRETVIGMISQ
ncbi:MAG: [protein-PII] uridylyltransferase [Methylococcales bacterium]